MTAIDRILVAVDDDTAAELALTTGFALAADHGAEVVVLGIVPDVERWSDSLADVFGRETLREGYVAHRRAQLQRLVARHAGDAAVCIEVAAGIGFVEVIRAALAARATLIVQASHADAGRRVFFTSADWHLMRKSPVPVWIVKDAVYSPAHVCVAVDAAAPEPDAEAFNRNILTLANAIAARSGARLSVVSAWELPGAAALRESALLHVPAERFERALQRAQTAAEQAQARLRRWFAARAPAAASARWHLVKGPAREAIPSFVAERRVDLLVMGTLGRTGIPGLLIGNTAETVLSRIECSALTLKPAPFVSPVA